jgi:hypothetical protein
LLLDDDDDDDDDIMMMNILWSGVANAVFVSKGGRGSDETQYYHYLVTIHRVFKNSNIPNPPNTVNLTLIMFIIFLVTIHCAAPGGLAGAGRSTRNQTKKMEHDEPASERVDTVP